MRILGIVPARGGSKGVRRKNIRPLGGKPLLCYTAEAALASRSIAMTVLSTEDEEIAELGRVCGLHVPFLRPPELSKDDTPTLPVVVHALNWMERAGEKFDAVCLLQPTSPFRASDTIDACVDMLIQTQADSIVTVRLVPTEYNPHWVFKIDSTGQLRLFMKDANVITRRQALPPAYFRDGSIYLTRRNVILEDQSLYGQVSMGFIQNDEQHVNIDTLEDWERAEAILRKREL